MSLNHKGNGFLGSIYKAVAGSVGMVINSFDQTNLMDSVDVTEGYTSLRNITE